MDAFTMATKPEQLLMKSLNLPSCLRDRILCRVPPSLDSAKDKGGPNQQHQQQQHNNGVAAGGRFVLYLPTVVLRKKHNPAFALACRLANHHGVPLVVLVTLLDDRHLSKQPCSPVVMTSRRLAFVVEALKDSCCSDWEHHGAGVAIRVHGPGCRTPHHMSLAYSSVAVVSDEPFVEPYREYVRKVARTCSSASVPFWTVDGSTSVPPNSKLVRTPPSSNTSTSTNPSMMEGDVSFAGAPSKAWRWEKQTESVRKQHVYGATREKALDAPALECKLPADFFLLKIPQQAVIDPRSDEIISNINSPWLENLLHALPSKWKDREVPSPGQRPWSVGELSAVEDCKAWALAWKGADSSVKPCAQTDGSVRCARRRWKSFLTSGGLKDYAKKRNAITNPLAVSRVSCYLNLGVLSIFEVLQDVWEAKAQRGYATGCNKFLDEVGKWREGSYVHAFAHPNYHTVEVLPAWSRRYLEGVLKAASGSSSNSNNNNNGYDYKALEGASTTDKTWNAMQDYLIETGELHNNARMTWGKTVVHWQASRVSTEESLWQLCCLNDRFALDGLSPPSYGGVMWCYGWQDKPSGGNKVSEKWASRYRTGPSGFFRAKELLLSSSPPSLFEENRRCGALSGKRSTTAQNPIDVDDDNEENNDDGTLEGIAKKPRCDSKKNILSYFGPAATGTSLAARQIG